MSATSGGGGSVSEGSEAGGSSQSTMSVSDSPSTSFQANLSPENITKITLSEENSAGGYAADVTGSKVNLTLDERQQKDGIVNVAFDYEESANRSGSGGAGAGDGFRSMNGSEKKDKVPEAVNLELVNMVPYSNGNGTSYGVPINGIPGIPMKKDSEQVDMSTPYDEYFVPVNEHKKYMRGEKLYVTKDKRRPTSWRRCLSWVVACTVISVVLIVAILAGTGVILSQEPDLVNDASVGRNFAGSNLKPSVTEKSLTPTAEKLMYVPRSIESEFVIDNLDFDPALRNLNSSEYQQFTSKMEDHLKMLLFDKETLEMGASDVGIKVVNISRDPFKVNYRIGWNYKQGVNNPPEPIKMEDVKRRLVESLARNEGYIDKYHIDSEAIKVNHVINACQMENGGCSHICYYNYISQLFTCTCPTHLVLDSTGKNCVAWSGSSEDDAVPVPSHGVFPEMPYETTTNTVPDFEQNERFQPGVYQDVHHRHDTGSHYSTESDSKNYQDQQHRDNEPTAEPIPEPTAELDLNQGHKSSSEFEAKPEPIPKSDEKETHVAEHERNMHSNTYNNGINSQNEHIQPDIHSYQETTTFEDGVQPTAASTPEDHYHNYAVHSVHGSNGADVVFVPTPSPEPTSDSTTSKTHVHMTQDHEPTAEPIPEPTPEPTVKPDFEDKNAGRSVHDTTDLESAAKPNHEKSDEHHIIHSVYEPMGHEQPTPEIGYKTTTVPNAEDKNHAIHSLDNFKDYEPSTEPSLELASSTPAAVAKDYVLHTSNEFKYNEPAAEPTPEPTPEPTVVPHTHGKNDAEVTYYNNKDNKPLAQSTPEPAVEAGTELNPEDKSHTAIISNVFDFKDKPGTATTTEFSLQDQDKQLATQFVPMTKESAETFPQTNNEGSEKVHDSHSMFASKDKELRLEPKVEYNLKDKNKELDVPYVYSMKDASTEATVEPNLHAGHGHVRGNDNDQTTEHNPKLPVDFTPALPVDNDHQIQMTTSRGSEYFETTHHVQQAQDSFYLGPNFSVKDPSERANSHEGQLQATEFKTENPYEAHPTNQSEANKENKFNHTVPYLQDVLIRRPDSDLSNKNATQHGQDVLQNVERTANGEPIIEEIVIEKLPTKNQNETVAYSPTLTSDLKAQFGNETNHSNLTTPEAPSVHQSAVDNSFNDNSTNKYSFMNKNFGQPSTGSETKVVSPITVEGTTDIPLNFEMRTTLHSMVDEKGMGATENIRNIEHPTDIYGAAVANNNQNPLSNYNMTANNYSLNIMPLNPDNRTTGFEHNLTSLSKNSPGVTIQPEVQNEFHTIPVAIQFSNTEGKTNIESNLKQENHSEKPELNTTPALSEESTEIIKHLKTDTFPSSTGSDVIKVQETTTVSHIPVTTVPSVLLPDMANMNMNEQLTNAKNDEGKLKEINIENRPVNTHSPLEANGTTKSPEEFSNNIKDELLDNEEFNTLLGKEYKNKEISSTDGKDLLNKYPNKSQKVEKKKIKDYAKGEKLDPDKKIEVTVKPAVTPEDFILQKHVNGHENTFDLEYSLQNEHTTKHDGEVTIIDPHGFDGIPGVSFKPHGINNHDLRVLQTVAPDFRAETDKNHDLETQKLDSKIKILDNKEGEFKQDKDYPKFDKDYKYEKQKVSKKKDLKKKTGSGKDGKNVELDDGRKYFVEVSKEDVDSGFEVIKDVPETTMNPSFEKITPYPEVGVKITSGSAPEATTVPEQKAKVETTPQPSQTVAFEEKRGGESVMEHLGPSKSLSEENSPAVAKVPLLVLPNGNQSITSVDQNYHQIVDEPLVKTISNISSGIVDDGQFNSSYSRTSQVITNTSILAPNVESRYINASNGSGAPEFVFDGISNDTATHGSISSPGFENSASTSGETVQTTSFEVPKLITNEGTIFESGVVKNSTANPTIIIHGQSGSLQDGHTARFANSTFYNTGNATISSVLNGTLNHPDGQSFIFKNYTTFPNGSVVHPTIIVRGQSGTLQDGHEIKFGNATFGTSLPQGEQVLKNSAVYRIENGSLPGATFDKNFDPQNSQYYTFTNSTGTFAFTNATETQPAFIIKGESGDFGNSRAYIMSNDSGSTFSRNFPVPSVIFRNSTVFAVGNTPSNDSASANVFKITAAPQDVTLNDTIHYTHQVSPNFFSTGTAYKVNNYFGYISKCAAGQFQCVNGTSKRGSACISLSSKCDSINDCSDGSDELGCIENGCPGNFQCSDGSCLKRNLVCNGILDCSDGSDEKQCESWKCEFDEFQCPSGRCIPVVWQCDGKPDCDNHTDEYNCQTSCGNDEYLCPEGWCVPLTYKCNGVKECSNGEDEQLCDCSHEEFKCQTGGCVSMKQVCDGLDDCPDRSDEWDCVKIDPVSNLLKIRTATRNYEPVCADNWTSQYSDEVCMSLGYYSSVPIQNENSSSITTDMSFFSLKNVSTGNFNKKVILNLRKSEGNCSSGKMVEIACQEFTCGSRSMTHSSSIEARLVGGMSAAAGQWPSVALLYNIRNFHSCTANVLTPRWVLASYNCLKMGNKNLNEQDWKFYGGSTVFEAEAENAETRNIVSIIPHPQVKFNQFLFSNDLALVELNQSLHFTNNLGAVCLPEQEMQPRQICVTAGWGMNAPEDKSMRQQLQYLPVPTMNLTECNSTEHYSGFITDDKICAGYNSPQKSLCYNEEGAPLMCVNDRGEWELQGVLSYHSNCGRGSHPSIFSSITPVADWIRKTIGNAFERKTVTVTKR